MKLGKLIRFQISVMTVGNPERKPSKCCTPTWSQLNRPRERELGTGLSIHREVCHRKKDVGTRDKKCQ